MALALIFGVLTACDSADDAVSLEGLEFCFLPGLEVFEPGDGAAVEAKQPASVDLSKATFCIGDEAIVTYTRSEYSWAISPDALPPTMDDWPAPPLFGFVMSFDGEPVASGPALVDLVATRVEGPQVRIGFDGSLSLSTTSGSGANPFEELGVSDDTVESIGRHFDRTGRLR